MDPRGDQFAQLRDSLALARQLVSEISAVVDPESKRSWVRARFHQFIEGDPLDRGTEYCSMKGCGRHRRSPIHQGPPGPARIVTGEVQNIKDTGLPYLDIVLENPDSSLKIAQLRCAPSGDIDLFSVRTSGQWSDEELIYTASFYGSSVEVAHQVCDWLSLYIPAGTAYIKPMREVIAQLRPEAVQPGSVTQEPAVSYKPHVYVKKPRGLLCGLPGCGLLYMHPVHHFRPTGVEVSTLVAYSPPALSDDDRSDEEGN